VDVFVEAAEDVDEPPEDEAVEPLLEEVEEVEELPPSLDEDVVEDAVDVPEPRESVR